MMHLFGTFFYVNLTDYHKWRGFLIDAFLREQRAKVVSDRPLKECYGKFLQALSRV